jgi:hypothetical protein
MPGAGAFNIGGQNADRRQVAKPDISPGAERARQGALQRAREGDQLDLREAMNTLIAIGDLIPAADYHDRDDEPDLPDEEQAEIDNRDEDAPEPDEREEESYDRPEKPLKPSGNRPDECEAVENIKPFRILVEGDTCRFERPDWWGCEPVFKAGYSLVADTERKFRMMSALADWLSNNRKDFLRDPDPWHLGVSALEEFKAGWASVVQKDFHLHARLDRFADRSLFSRDIRKTDLVFEDGGQLPLGFLFEDKARMAWVAQVVKSLANGGNMVQVLENYAHVTVPKGERDELLKKNPAALDFGGKIALACALAGGNQPVSWSATIKMFKNRMLE